MYTKSLLNSLLVAFTLLCCSGTAMRAQQGSGGYSQPPKNILDVMRAPASPSPFINPTHDKLLLVSNEEYPSIARVATPFLRLAGVRVEAGDLKHGGDVREIFGGRRWV